MLIFEEYEASLTELAWSRGQGSTVIASGHGYDAYDRDVFVEALNDWQWTGHEEPPRWYTGVPNADE